MLSRRYKIFSLFLTVAFILSGGFAYLLSFKTAQAATNLNGRILLQVQDKGQAWYVNPLNSKRYYLGRADDAYKIMRSLGLGISDSDLSAFQKSAPRRLAGRILLQVQDKGQAYYLDPINLQLYYLGRPTDAFNLMRSRGLGITNSDLARIPVASVSTGGTAVSGETAAASGSQTSAAGQTAANFSFKFNNNNYDIVQNLNPTLYEAYKASPKTYTYYGTIEPADLRNSFYAMFLKARSGDTTLDSIVSNAKAIAVNNNWTSDQLVEFLMAFVQYIPYDHEKLAVSGNRNTDPYYPYETLYLDRGVCSDKTFLAVALLRKLGYGAEIMDFPEINHTAAGIACPTEYSINGSGYCYAEMTNYFPLGVIPQSINAGQAQTSDNGFSNLFNPANLGKIEIYQKTTGKVYQGVAAVHTKVQTIIAAKSDLESRQADISSREAAIRVEEGDLVAMKTQMDSYYNGGQVSQYNSLVPAYNIAVNKYNADINDYQGKVAEYNQKVADFNGMVKSFYQE